MANTFYATTKIKHGAREEDNSQDGKYVSTVFEVNDKVEGLSKEDMESLWNAGALRKGGGSEDDDNADESAEDKTPTQSPTPVKATPVKATPAKAQPSAKS
jgi:hypothetical protein